MCEFSGNILISNYENTSFFAIMSISERGGVFMVKLLCGWGGFSLLLLVWDWLLAPVFGFFVDDFFRGYLCVTIAIFCFALAYHIWDGKE